MDMTKFAESRYVTVDYVKTNGSKLIGAIIEPPKEEVNKFGNPSAVITVQVKIGELFFNKIYKPNMDAVKNLNREFGTDGDKWNGKLILFEIKTVAGKDTLVVSANK
jgi:hypothetical protein